ncbi:MAG: ABC transporter ATP-binding protein [Acidobacteriota bacterium]
MLPAVTPKVQVESLVKTYREVNAEPVVAVAEASFQVAEAEFFVLLGPSGCGKSTILRMVSGLELPSAGQVLVDGRAVDGPGRDRGLVFQAYTSFPWLTVEENVGFGLELRGVKVEEQQRVVAHFLEVTGLAEFRHAYPKELSGGMKQRVAIARTMANSPDILLMDEPFGALDVETRWQMQELLLEVWRETRTTVLFVTHDIEEAIFLGDRIYISTARPSRCCDVVDVPFGRPRPSAIKTSVPFRQLEGKIHGLFRNQALEEWKGQDS